MTIFNPQNKSDLTYGECLDPAMKITDPRDANQYFRDYVAYIQKYLDNETSNMTAEDIAKTNLGYYAGYYDSETRERVEELFNCQHPIFGSIRNGSPTAKEAFEAGLKYGKNLSLKINRKDKLE